MSKGDDKEKGEGIKNIQRHRPVRETVRETDKKQTSTVTVTNELSRNCRHHFKEGTTALRN